MATKDFNFCQIYLPLDIAKPMFNSEPLHQYTMVSTYFCSPDFAVWSTLPIVSFLVCQQQQLPLVVDNACRKRWHHIIQLLGIISISYAQKSLAKIKYLLTANTITVLVHLKIFLFTTDVNNTLKCTIINVKKSVQI